MTTYHVTQEDIDRMERIEKSYLAKPLRKITESQFFYALEVLPPMRWVRENGLETFCMMEYTCGFVTAQYACRASLRGHGPKEYFCKNVDIIKPETFITHEMIDAWHERNEKKKLARKAKENHA